MKIVFWSPMHGTGTTGNMLATAVALHERLGKSVTVTHGSYCMNNLETSLLSKCRSGDMTDMGLDALIRRFKAGELTKELIDECSFEITEGFTLIPGGRGMRKEIYDNSVNLQIENRIYQEVQKLCDVLMIDLCPGDCDRSRELMKDADIVVVNLRQNRMMLDEYESHLLQDIKGQVIYAFGMYDNASRYSLHNLIHRYSFLSRRNSYRIPYLSDYLDSMNEASVNEFIRCGVRIDRWKGKEGRFFSCVRDITEGIGEMI